MCTKGQNSVLYSNLEFRENTKFKKLWKIFRLFLLNFKTQLWAPLYKINLVGNENLPFEVKK